MVCQNKEASWKAETAVWWMWPLLCATSSVFSSWSPQMHLSSSLTRHQKNNYMRSTWTVNNYWISLVKYFDYWFKIILLLEKSFFYHRLLDIYTRQKKSFTPANVCLTNRCCTVVYHTTHYQCLRLIMCAPVCAAFFPRISWRKENIDYHQIYPVRPSHTCWKGKCEQSQHKCFGAAVVE